jgi:hypothetical protein
MQQKPPPFTRHGTPENRIEVSADEILDAIVEGRDVDVRYAIIRGGLKPNWIAAKLERDKEGRLLIKSDVKIQSSVLIGEVNFRETSLAGVDFLGVEFRASAVFFKTHFGSDTVFANAVFKGVVTFGSANFVGKANFDSVTFSKGVRFDSTVFTGVANFREACFSEDVLFSGAEFKLDVSFRRVIMAYPASFYNVKFRENTVCRGLWNNTVGRTIKRLSTPVSNFDMDTNVVMDASTNPYLKRYIDDEQWIASWRQRGRGRKILFFFWELTSHCGRSIGLWAFWSFLLAVIFGFLYRGHVYIDPHTANNWYTPFYFSVVTFTTLGFGDVKPADWIGQLWITLEVILGYVMLGGLISIFANKFARRS